MVQQQKQHEKLIEVIKAQQSQRQEITMQMLSGKASSTQKQIIGEELFPQVYKIEPQMAIKVTGLLLDMDNQQLLDLLQKPEQLVNQVSQARS